jgi:hypothetical protein
MRKNALRLDPVFRRTLYGFLTALFVTGATWLVADALKTGPDAEMWQPIAANLLMLHGGAAMATLMLFGALVPLHILRAWRAKRNRNSGIVIAGSNALLIVTAFGLYYLGSESVRSWASYVHIGFGFALPVLALIHILLGRRQSRELRGTT